MISDHLRIAYVCTQDAQDRQSLSGTPYHVVAALRKRHHTVRLISPLRRSLKYLYAPHKLLWNRTLQVDRQPLMLASFAAQIGRSLKNTDADLVIAPSSIPIAYLECPQPILWWTDAVYESMIDYYPGFDRRNARRAHQQEESAMRRAAQVIYSSDWAARVARTHYPEHTHKISVIAVGANSEPPAIPERAPKPPYKLLFLGVDWQRKGGSIAVEATERMNLSGIPSTLRVVGCDIPRAEAHREYLEPHGFISRRTPQGRAMLSELLLSSDLLLLPTRAECAGIAFCEASAYGLPIVSTDTGGVSTYVVNGASGVLLPPDATPAQYASVMAEILSSPDVYARLSRGARREFETRLNWDAGVQTLLNLACPGSAQTRKPLGSGH